MNEKDKGSSGKELTELLTANIDGPGQLCRITIQNRTPPDWHATIVAVGTRFWYKNGGEMVDGPHDVNVSTGGDTYTSNNDPNKCVGIELTGITVRVPNEPDTILQGQEQCPPGANNCMIGATHTVTPKAAGSDNTSASRSVGSRLEIRTQL